MLICTTAGPWTGGSMNPARVLAGLIVYQVQPSQHCYSDCTMPVQL